jgi:hypothetical protein
VFNLKLALFRVNQSTVIGFCDRMGPVAPTAAELIPVFINRNDTNCLNMSHSCEFISKLFH